MCILHSKSVKCVQNLHCVRSNFLGFQKWRFLRRENHKSYFKKVCIMAYVGASEKRKYSSIKVNMCFHSLFIQELCGSFLKSAFALRSVRETPSRRQIREEGSLQKKSRQANISVLSGFYTVYGFIFNSSLAIQAKIPSIANLDIVEQLYVYQLKPHHDSSRNLVHKLRQALDLSHYLHILLRSRFVSIS